MKERKTKETNTRKKDMHTYIHTYRKKEKDTERKKELTNEIITKERKEDRNKYRTT